MHMCYKQFLHHLGTGCCLPKTTFRTKIGGGWARGASKRNWDPLLISATVEASNFKFGTQLGFGTGLPKNQRFGPKLVGLWAKGASEKIWDPLRIFATAIFATLAALNLVHNLGLRLAYQKTTFWTKIAGGVGQRSIPEKFATPTYFCNR